MGYCNAETIKNLSFLMSDEELCKIASQAVRNGTYRLYSGDLLEKALLYKKLGTVNVLLNSGYSFPNS